jgi:hypothetical protein
MSRDQYAEQYSNVPISNKLFEKVENIRYFGINLANQNSILEEINSTLKSRNASYNSVQNLLSSRLLSKNVKLKIYRTILLPGVFYGCETWSLTSKEECRLRVLENRVLRRIFGLKWEEVTGEWRRLHNKELYAL